MRDRVVQGALMDILGTDFRPRTPTGIVRNTDRTERA